MAISLFDFTKGLDFTALVSAAAADHNTLVDGAVPYATDKGIVAVSTDTALNTPDVPNAAVTTKWKNYIWVRRPHSTATNTTPIAYMWNENAASVTTYLKWERIPADTTAVEALIADLTLRVDDLEAVNVTNTALINAANSNAATALTNSSSALSTANAANANALQALSDLDTPTTGVKDRLTAVETVNASQTGSINTINSQITTINNTLGSGLGPIFIAPILIATSAAGGTIAWTSAGAVVPVAAKAVILQIAVTGGVVGTAVKTISVRSSSAGSTYTALQSIGSTTVMAWCGASEGSFDYKVEDSNPAGGFVATIQLIGYVL